MKNLMTKVATVICCTALIGVLSCAPPAPKSVSPSPSAKKIVLNKYPALKWGLSTASFSKFLPPNVANVKKIIDFASEQGFVFIELRDTANLSLSDCTEIATYAKQKNIEVVYAVGVGILDANYPEAVINGIAKAKVFNSTAYIRTAAGGTECASDREKVAWNADEFAKLVEIANKAGDTARVSGLQLVLLCAKNGRFYIAIEPDSGAANTVEDIYNNYIESTEYLQKNY